MSGILGAAGRFGRVAATAATVWLGVSVAAIAQPAGGKQPDKAAAAPAKAGAAPVLLLERAGLDKFLVDEKDAGLKRAVEMLPSRIREVPGEIPGAGQIPPTIIDLLVTVASRPARLAVTYNPDETGGAFGLGLVVSVLAADKDQANSMHGTINALVGMAGLARGGEDGGPQLRKSEKYPLMSETPVMVSMLRFGPRQAKDGWRCELHFGSLGDPDQPFAAFATRVRPGSEPVLRARLDLSALTPLVENLKEMAGGDPQAEQWFDALTRSGTIGPDAVKYDMQFGYTAAASVSTTVLEGAKRHAAGMGLGTTALTEADLRAIPADSYAAGIRQLDLSQLQGMLQQARAANEQVEQGLAMFQQATGVDPIADILGSLGGTVGYYMADSTGGRGLMAGVLFASIADHAKLDAANDKLVAAANTALPGPTRGYVRVRTWSDGGSKLVSVIFPGLPVPLEFTYAMTDRLLILGLSPQAAVAAVRQAGGKGDKGLGANSAVAEAMKGRSVESIGFVDTPRTMAAGYQFVGLFGTALENLVRSPHDPAREPGMVVPTYPELASRARPSVSVGYWDGDNLVRESQGDRSLLVRASGTIGAAEPFFPVIAAMIAAAGVAQQQQHSMMPRLAPPPPDDDDGPPKPPPPPPPSPSRRPRAKPAKAPA